MNKHGFRASGALVLLGVALIYGTFGVLVRGTSQMWGVDAGVAVRFSLAFIVLLAITRRSSARLPIKKLPLVIGLGLSGAAMVLCFSWSVMMTSLAAGVFALYAGSIISSFLVGTLYLREKTGVARILAAVLALGGIAIFAGMHWQANAGMFVGFFAGVVDTLSNVFRKKLVAVDTNNIVKLQHLIGACVVWLVVLVRQEEVIRQVTIYGILCTAIFVGLMIAVGKMLLYGFQHFDVNTGTVVLSAELVFASIFGLLLFGEHLAAHQLLGGLLILCASTLGAVGSHNNSAT